SFPEGTWLPAAKLELEETWSADIDSLQLGDSVTRNVSLRAEGLSSSLLPALEYVDIPGLKFYPDQALREDELDHSGVVGLRSEGTALVASEPGHYLLPEIRLPWWNTTTDTLEYASIPARELQVTGSTVNPPEETLSTASPVAAA